jgi:hypothetical protein
MRVAGRSRTPLGKGGEKQVGRESRGGDLGSDGTAKNGVFAGRRQYNGGMKELVFEMTQEEDGGYVAECLSEEIFCQADSWQELRANVREAARAFYFDQDVTFSTSSLKSAKDFDQA